MTLEGECLSADDLVVRRDMLASARIDGLGLRVSFVLAVALLMASLVFSGTAFAETLQFFAPNYTVFALSLLPVSGFAVIAFRLRPRRHFTVVLRDGSALAMLSNDLNFLSRCLEAFESMWTDRARARASLYLHSAHRSVDFGPPSDGLSGGADDVVEDPLSLTLPVFDDRENVSDPPPVTPFAGCTAVEAASEEVPAATEGRNVDQAAEQALAEALEASQDEPVVDPPSEDAPFEDGPAEDTPAAQSGDEASGHHDEVWEAPEGLLPPPPPAPEDGELADNVAAPEDDEDLLVPYEGVQDDEAAESLDEAPAAPVAAPRQRIPLSKGVPVEHFEPVKPRVQAFVRLLRERAPDQDLTDSIAVLELMTRRGCSNALEVRALARAIKDLKSKMGAYPTAIDLLDEVALRADVARLDLPT